MTGTLGSGKEYEKIGFAKAYDPTSGSQLTLTEKEKKKSIVIGQYEFQLSSKCRPMDPFIWSKSFGFFFERV